jgi:hypothetical protein
MMRRGRSTSYMFGITAEELSLLIRCVTEMQQEIIDTFSVAGHNIDDDPDFHWDLPQPEPVTDLLDRLKKFEQQEVFIH